MEKQPQQKLRFDLLPAQGTKEACKVLTSKLNKYEKNEWTKGLKWTDVLSSLKNHLLAFETGDDFNEDGNLNIAEVAADALILAEYYSSFPQGDDRIIGTNAKPVVCCDLDDCVFDFIGAYEDRFGKTADYWSGDYAMPDRLKELQEDKDFWVNMPLKNRPNFEINYYVTARSIPIEWTREAIAKNNLPMAPIFTLPWNASKIDKLKELGCDIMIDDKYQTYKECQAAGIFCYLMDTPSNQYYNVGHRRIYDLNLNLK